MNGQAQSEYVIRQGAVEEDSIFIDFLYEMWDEMGSGSFAFVDDWRQRAEKYLAESRQNRNFKSFFAELDGKVAGITAAETYALYPLLLKNNIWHRGLVWGVYVRPQFRRKGIAAALVKEANSYIRSLGCEEARLHASDAGRPVYEKLGYAPTNELGLKF